MQLETLCEVLLQRTIIGDPNTEITAVTSDSRRAGPGSLFIALRGYTVDGHAFAQAAVEQGAVAVLCETPLPGVSAVQVVVPDSRRASAILADRFHGHPSNRLKVIGVTGTNGKTTVTYLIEQIMEQAGLRTGRMGTTGTRIGSRTLESVNTTPEAVELHETLAEMRDAGCDVCAMEVSSHALELGRVAGIRFRTAVFTNLTQDHLDFHGTMEHYLAAKGKLFSRLGNGFADTYRDFSFAVLNVDDPACQYLQEQTVTQYLTYGIDQPADVRATNLKICPNGVRFTVECFAGTVDIEMSLTGRFNVYNALAAIACGLIEQIPLPLIAQGLSNVTGVPGRLERIDAGQPFTVLVDYSHTPDSLDNALSTICEFATGRVLTVFGCGGDRDKGKRPAMGQVALNRSDWTILTSDNPRTEDPEAILDDIEAGCREIDPNAERYERISDRMAAIQRAIQLAQANDVILIAGKGHETYQMIGTQKFPFDDREVARTAIASLG